MRSLVAIALAGAAGATCRALLDGVVTRRVGVPWGTAAVNVAGSFGAGVVAGLVLRGVAPPALATVVSVGFLGAFTTFSTWMVQTATMLEERQHGRALLSTASLAAGVLAALAGLLLAR